MTAGAKSQNLSRPRSALGTLLWGSFEASQPYLHVQATYGDTLLDVRLDRFAPRPGRRSGDRQRRRHPPVTVDGLGAEVTARPDDALGHAIKARTAG